MTATRIWYVKFGAWDHIYVVAPNIKEAINTARKRRKGQYANRIQDITYVELEAEAE